MSSKASEKAVAISYLKELNDSLWPSTETNHQDRIVLQARRQMTTKEWRETRRHIEAHDLVCEMFMMGMFGGYGIDVYDHPESLYPGLPEEPVFLIRIIETNLPAPKDADPKVPGCGREYAWEAFSKFTHAQRNQDWLKRYKLRPSEDQGSYCY